MNDKIKEAIESLPRDNPERRESILDALYCVKAGQYVGTGTEMLEKLFDYWLWSEGEPQQEAHLAYVIALGEIEEHLCMEGLIYQDVSASDETGDNRLSDVN